MAQTAPFQAQLAMPAGSKRAEGGRSSCRGVQVDTSPGSEMSGARVSMGQEMGDKRKRRKSVWKGGEE